MNRPGSAGKGRIVVVPEIPVRFACSCHVVVFCPRKILSDRNDGRIDRLCSPVIGEIAANNPPLPLTMWTIGALRLGKKRASLVWDLPGVSQNCSACRTSSSEPLGYFCCFGMRRPAYPHRQFHSGCAGTRVHEMCTWGAVAMFVCMLSPPAVCTMASGEIGREDLAGRLPCA